MLTRAPRCRTIVPGEGKAIIIIITSTEYTTRRTLQGHYLCLRECMDNIFLTLDYKQINCLDKGNCRGYGIQDVIKGMKNDGVNMALSPYMDIHENKHSSRITNL